VVEVAVTGIGLVTPLGCEPERVLDRILKGERAIQPAPFGPSPISPLPLGEGQRVRASLISPLPLGDGQGVRASFVCPVSAPVADFDAARHFPDNKTLRLMNRDAQMAVVAARLAMGDAGLTPGELYPAEEIALYGATGLCGMPPAEIAGLLRSAAAADGSLSLERFGRVALRRIRPVLSFKILANMPVCFVSIFGKLRGPNAVYTPWEGQGAQAIAAGVRAVARREVPCAVVGGCDVKTHALAFLSLQQMGVFDSWRRHAAGSVPGEGAAFLVLEEYEAAVRRGARVYAIVRAHSAGSVVSPLPTDHRSVPGEGTLAEVLSSVLRGLEVPSEAGAVLAGDGDPVYSDAEQTAMESIGIAVQGGQSHFRCAKIGTVPGEQLRPKSHLGNLFAAAAAVQMALAAVLANRHRRRAVLANCFGHGTEQAAFLLEAP
jgi:3-oxoacyl-[acyl-carrier-protein] synthase II